MDEIEDKIITWVYIVGGIICILIGAFEGNSIWAAVTGGLVGLVLGFVAYTRNEENTNAPVGGIIIGIIISQLIYSLGNGVFGS